MNNNYELSQDIVRDIAQVRQIIQTTLTRRGNGKEDPIRIITQFWSLEGELLAEVDPLSSSNKESQ